MKGAFFNILFYHLAIIIEKKAIEFLAVYIVAGAFIGENEVGDDAILFNDLGLPR